MGAPTTWTGGFPPDVDWPQTEGKDPPGHHEAIWTWGYDPAVSAGYYLYLLHDPDDDALRNEVVTIYLPDGSILRGMSRGRRSAGRTAAGDGLALECIDPFRRWVTSYDGQLVPLAWDAAEPAGEPVAVHLRFDMDAAAPAWNVEGDWGERPPNLRFHQLYRVSNGELVVGDVRLPIGGTTMRGHSRRERDLSRYTGHVVATALFDDRAFGMFAFFGEGTSLRSPHGYVVLDGEQHEAIVEHVPVITGPRRAGEPLRFVLSGDFGTVEITGETVVTTYGSRGVGPQAGLATSIGIARYEWDGQVAYGPVDRCHALGAP